MTYQCRFSFKFVLNKIGYLKGIICTIVHSWCDSHFTCISVYGMWRARIGVQVLRREFHTHIHLESLDSSLNERVSHIYTLRLF